jgi:hypothetical protein
VYKRQRTGTAIGFNAKLKIPFILSRILGEKWDFFSIRDVIYPLRGRFLPCARFARQAAESLSAYIVIVYRKAPHVTDFVVKISMPTAALSFVATKGEKECRGTGKAGATDAAFCHTLGFSAEIAGLGKKRRNK